MLVHPYHSHLPTHDGTRLIDASLDTVGTVVIDPRIPARPWMVQALFAPISRRMIGGVRAQLIDQRGFVSFINQRDLEVLLGLGAAGRMCPWMGGRYIGVGERDWCGLFVDKDDLIDDLQMRELALRTQLIEQGYGQQLRPGSVLTRLVHVDEGEDVEEVFTLLWDLGYSDLDEIESRWVCTTRRRIEWQRVPLLA